MSERAVTPRAENRGAVAVAERAPLIGAALPSILSSLSARVPQIVRRPGLVAGQAATAADVDHVVIGVAAPNRGPIADVAVGHDGTKLFVTHFGADSVSVVDTKDWHGRRIDAVNEPFGIAVSPAGDGRAYVATVAQSGAYDTVSVVDTDTRTVIATHPVAVAANQLAVDPDGKRVYVAGAGRHGAEVAVVDVIASAVTTIGLAAASALALCVDAGGDRLYVATTGPAGGGLAVIDLEANRVVATIGAGAPIRAVAMGPGRGTVYLLRYDDDRGGLVDVVDTARKSVVRSIEVGGVPTALTIGADGAHAYVVGETQVDVIRTATGEFVDALSVDTRPSSVAVSPDGTRLYVADYDGQIVAFALRAR
jgi:DNA-binding beta-propeller fold protein YncE